MADKITIWNPEKELRKLEEKVAKLEEDKEVENHILLVPKAALKEAEWEEDFIREAIERGRAKARGEEIGDPSWKAIDDDVPETPEVPGLETTEEEPAKPGRVFNLLGDMGGEESEEREKVREEEPEESPFLEREGETRVEYYLRMFDEFFGPTKEEEAMETEVTKENLTEKMAQHLADSRRKITVGKDIGWLCEKCNSVWSLEQQICPNRCKKAEPPTVESRGWPKEEGSGLVADVRFPEEEAGDPLAADPDWLRKHMAGHLELEAKPLEEKKEEMAKRVKEALGIDRFPDEPEPCPLCDAMDGELCGCCGTCEEQKCKCCELCSDFPCVCDTTEECPICDARMPIGDACPTGCDADMMELVNLYEEVKHSKTLSFEEKVRYMSLLKEKMNFAENEEAEEQMPEIEIFDEPEAEDDPGTIEEE